jgi:mono/diheme cytochrome c family protein
MTRSAVIAVCVALGLALGACGMRAEAAPPPVDPLAAETSAWKAALPVFQKYCSHCHTEGGKVATRKKLNHFNFTSYPITGHHAPTIGVTIRNVLGLSGKKARMPADKPGSVTGNDLALIKAWTDAWEAADKAGAHAAAAAH